MRVSKLQAGQIVRFKSTGGYGIIATVDWTERRDRFPYIDILSADKEDHYYGFFICWLMDPEYDAMELLDIVASPHLMERLTEKNVSEIINLAMQEAHVKTGA